MITEPSGRGLGGYGEDESRRCSQAASNSGVHLLDESRSPATSERTGSRIILIVEVYEHRQ